MEVHSYSLYLFIDGSYLPENLFCAGTYAKILDSIAASALKNADLKLNTKVTRIETSSAKVKVVTDKGVEEEFDEVVMTAPLGFLKQNKHIFVPPLPQGMAQAIDAIGYGSLEKVEDSLLLFDELIGLTAHRFTLLSPKHSGWAMARILTRNLSPVLHSGCHHRMPQKRTRRDGIKKSSICQHYRAHALIPHSSSIYLASNQLLLQTSSHLYLQQKPRGNTSSDSSRHTFPCFPAISKTPRIAVQ